jgi:regulator of vacuolar morphogenesis
MNEGSNVDEQTLQGKKSIASVNLRLNALGDALDQESIAKNLTDGELIRRKDVIRNLKIEKDELSRHFVSKRHLAGSEATSSKRWPTSSSSGPRVFGKVDETDETRGRDNRQVLELQNSLVQQQDEQLDQMLNVVKRQKEIGRAIGDELDLQNQLLGELDQRVDFTKSRLSGAGKQLKRLH